MGRWRGNREVHSANWVERKIRFDPDLWKDLEARAFENQRAIAAEIRVGLEFYLTEMEALEKKK